MASLAYLSGVHDILRGNIDCDTDTFKMMLVGSSYVANGITHTKRSDVTAECTGIGYTAGGIPVTATVTKDTANNRVDMALTAPDLVGVNFDGTGARAGVVYKSRGGAASADELLAYVDFGSDKDPNGGTLAFNFTSPLRIQA